VEIEEISGVQVITVQYRDWRIRFRELGQHSKGIEEEMTRRLHSDLK
jgi:hypothetical protein